MSDGYETGNPRILAECSDYEGLIHALRARVKERRIVLGALDDVTGLPDRYSSKVLSPTPTAGRRNQRALSLHSLGPILQALGVKLHLVEDPDAVRRYCSRAETLDRKSLAGLAAPQE